MKKNAVKIRAIYADTDAMGVVYHTNYIKWFEIGRTELLREMGIVYAELESTGYHLPVIKVYCHYLAPAMYDEIVCIETEIGFLRRAIIKFDYKIWDEKGEKTLVEGYTVHAFINNKGKIVRAPNDISEKFRNLPQEKLNDKKNHKERDQKA